jgi:hypothetical protein
MRRPLVHGNIMRGPRRRRPDGCRGVSTSGPRVGAYGLTRLRQRCSQTSGADRQGYGNAGAVPERSHPGQGPHLAGHVASQVPEQEDAHRCPLRDSRSPHVMDHDAPGQADHGVSRQEQKARGQEPPGPRSPGVRIQIPEVADLDAERVEDKPGGRDRERDPKQQDHPRASRGQHLLGSPLEAGAAFLPRVAEVGTRSAASVRPTRRKRLGTPHRSRG